MAIESDADLIGLMLDSGEELTYSGTDYTVLASETDGQTLDGGPSDVDGTIEVLMRETDIALATLPEGGAVTYNSASYRVQKIDHIGGGLSALYLEP